MNDYDPEPRKPSRLDTRECAALTSQARTDMALLMTMKDNITNKLTEAFAPQSLDVADESHLHEGHAGHRPGGETHFRVYIVSNAFAGKGRLERHRMINALLAQELGGGVHALAISALAPAEVAV
jgi:BolA family transcriptional regulator, general stress-responsive regulator